MTESEGVRVPLAERNMWDTIDWLAVPAAATAAITTGSELSASWLTRCVSGILAIAIGIGVARLFQSSSYALQRKLLGRYGQSLELIPTSARVAATLLHAVLLAAYTAAAVFVVCIAVFSALEGWPL